MIVMDHKNYRKEFAPSASGDEDGKEKTRAKIVIDVSVDKVMKVQELEMSMRVKYSVGFAWLDPRLKFRNLKDDARLNTVLGKEAEIIWFPNLSFDNALANRRVLIDAWSKVLVKRQAEGKLNELEDLHEALLFNGGHNQLVYSREFEHDFSCYFNLDLYPFDTQVCDMWIMAPSGEGLGKSIVLEMGKLAVAPAENVSLAQFQVTNTKMSQFNSTDVVVSLTFRRSLMYHFVTTYVPTTCLIIIAEATLMVDGSHHFETVTMVTLTSKLVLFTLYQTISGTFCCSLLVAKDISLVHLGTTCGKQCNKQHPKQNLDISKQN